MTSALEGWFRKVQRPLPWRQTYDPYHVWASEVMLQQTQVETVLPYYERFLKRFGTLRKLAKASEEDVLLLWSGLGYYSRARNFRAAARKVLKEHAGRIPASYDDLLELPGIGRYMAGAIMSIAFNEPYPIVDGNIRRILSRVNGWLEPKESMLWDAATQIVRSGEPRIVNQAMMELGATICRSKAPRCEKCPWMSGCYAFQTGWLEEIPAPRKRPKTVRVDLYAVIDRNQRGFLMCEAQGLWEFPTFPEPPAASFQKIGACRQSVTHHRVEVQIYEGKLGRGARYRRKKFDDLPVSSLTRKIYRVWKN